MSSAGQGTTSSTSNSQLIIDALADYTKTTGIDLSKNPFAAELEPSNSPQGILQILQEREKAVKEYRDGNQRLIDCFRSTVIVLQAFSGVLGEVVGGLVSVPPVNALFVAIDVLLVAASGVSSRYDTLLELFEYVGSFLKRLEIYTTIPPTPIMMDMIAKIIVELLSVLALATKQLEQGRFSKFAKKLLREREIEAVLQRLDRLTQDEARITVAQTLGVIYGLVGSVKTVMEDGKVSTDSIWQDLVALHQILNEINKTQRDELLRDVRRWLSPPDPSMNQNVAYNARLDGTTAWLFENKVFAEWKERGSLLWIHGKPGSGKSILLSAIIQDIKRMHAAGLATLAYYYFDFRDVKKQDRHGLLSSLISQLAAESDSCYSILSRLYFDNSRGIRQPSTNELKKCMTDMLSPSGQGPIYIIIDALDECPDLSGMPSAREEVLELIEELVDLKLPNRHLCVASRPEMDIRNVFEHLTSHSISLDEYGRQMRDIQDYVTNIVRADPTFRRWREADRLLVIDVVSRKSGGIFRLVFCWLEWLRHALPQRIRHLLADLPETLDEAYEHILRGIDKEKREHARRLFQCLTVSTRPLRVEEIAEIFTIRFDEAPIPTFNPVWRPENAIEAILSTCASFIGIVGTEGDRVVQFSHFSVKEFLTSERLAESDERLSYYHILLEPAHTTLARTCLSVLLHLDDMTDRNTIGRFPLALYAARHWVEHARFGNVASHVQEAMERLFDPANPHFTAWVWLYDIDRQWIEPMPTVYPTRPEAETLYYASLCGFRGLVALLIAADSPDVSGRGGSHMTPLHAASVKGHLEVASLLLKCGADPNSQDNQGRAPLHRVSQNGHLDIAQLLLDCGSDVYVRDEQRRTPLHHASYHGHIEVVRLLIDAGTPVDILNGTQKTPLALASWKGEVEVGRFLIERWANLNARDKQSRAPLHFAAQSGHPDMVRLLLEQGVDVNVQKDNLWSPLHLASAHGHLMVAQLLVQYGARVDVSNRKEETPLLLAAWNGRVEIARFLIDHGAICHTTNSNGWTPLHAASRRGHRRVVELLLERGANVDVLNKANKTAAELASENGQAGIVKLISEYEADGNGRNKDEEATSVTRSREKGKS